MKVAGLAVCAAAARRHKLTDEQVPLSLSAQASALTLAIGSIDPDRIDIGRNYRIFAVAMEVKGR